MTRTGNQPRWLGSGIYVCGRPVVERKLDEHGEPEMDDEGKPLMTPVLDEHGEKGICGSTLRPAPYGGKAGWKKPPAENDDPVKGRKRNYLYRCVASAHLTVTAEVTDAFVRDVMVEKLNDKRIRERMQPDPDPKFAASNEQLRKLDRDLQRFLRD